MEKTKKNLKELDVVSIYGVSDEMNVVPDYPFDSIQRMSEEEVRDIMEEENYLLGEGDW